MPEVKITQHRDGHTQEHTFHLGYDAHGERLAGRLTRMLHKHTKARRARQEAAPAAPRRSRRIR